MGSVHRSVVVGFVPATEPELGQEPRHLDSIDPVWNLLDLTPDGRGANWQPQLRYD
jgi:predicted dithiol-disulfide oxidoreductase (DUF899 family)